MTEYAIISPYTYRTMEDQRKAHKGKSIFVLPDDASALFRPTRRKSERIVHVSSIAVLAKKEKEFRDFIVKAKASNLKIVDDENERTFSIKRDISVLVNEWKYARLQGCSEVGWKRSAKQRKEKSSVDVEKVRALWCLPSSEYTIADIEEICGRSRGTIVSILGPRTVAQYNYQAAQKRKKRNDK